MAPPPLVYVLRDLFCSAYGLGRQLTCPMYGITRAAILEACAEDILIDRALSNFLWQGCFLYSGVAEELELALYEQLTREIRQVRDGKGDDIVSGVIDWVERVQVRALQDLAAEVPLQFQRAWCTLDYRHWDEHSQHWAVWLRNREDRDIGWVGAVEVPRLSVQRKILQVAKIIAAEDEYRWKESTERVLLNRCHLNTEDRIVEVSASVTEFEEDDSRAVRSRVGKAEGHANTTHGVRKRQRLEKDAVPNGNAGTGELLSPLKKRKKKTQNIKQLNAVMVGRENTI